MWRISFDPLQSQFFPPRISNCDRSRQHQKQDPATHSAADPILHRDPARADRAGTKENGSDSQEFPRFKTNGETAEESEETQVKQYSLDIRICHI